MKSIILKGPRVTLRPIKLADAPKYVRWFRDKEVVKYLAHQSSFSLEQEKKWIRSIWQSKKECVWAILNEEQKLIGNTGLRLGRVGIANLGIVIGERSQWGRGYGQETIKLLTRYVFDVLRRRRFELEVFTLNTRAIKSYCRLGFVKEGVRRKIRWNNITKHFADDMIMSMLREEWLKRNKR